MIQPSVSQAIDATISATEKAVQSREYRLAKARLSNREWRLDNLYWIKDKNMKEIPFKMNHAQRIYSRSQWTRDTITKGRQIGFCHHPSMRVLTSDLRWVKIDDIQVGQSVVAIDENVGGGRGKQRHMRHAIVEGKRDVFDFAYKLTMDNGIQLIATPGHRYLSKCSQGYLTWRAVKQMKVGQEIRAVTEPWGDNDFEDGWMAGLIDGEGCLSLRKDSFQLAISQVDGPVLERALKYLRDNNFNPRMESDERMAGTSSKLGNKVVHKICIGRLSEGFRLLGKLRPSRFMGREWWDGRRLPGKKNTWGKIMSIELLPQQRMIDIQTSTKTFICEGYVSHNSTFIELEILDDCIFRKNTKAGIVDITLDDGKEKLEKILYAYKRLPLDIRNEVRLEVENKEELRWSNGSSVSVGTSYRGGTLNFLHVSEYGKISARKPDVATEIKLGAFPAVPANGKIRVESTAEGVSGEFRELTNRAEKLALEGTPLTPLDFKSHFYPWWMVPEYRLPTSQVIIPAEMHAYFDELKAKHGIDLDGDQKAWYVKTREGLGPDAIWREHPSTSEEPWQASNKGAFFKDQMTRARLAIPPRVGRAVEYDPTRPVNTAWDLGVSSGRIIFHQSDGLRHRIIDYWESEDSGLKGSIAALKDKQAARGFIYGTHYGPHDLVNKDWSNMTAQNRREVAAEFGVNFHVVPRVSFKADSIEAARRFLENCWIDSEHASKLVEHLDNYSREWLKATGMFGEKPAKNGADHAADAVQQLAMALQPDKDEERHRRYPRQQKAGVTQWSA